MKDTLLGHQMTSDHLLKTSELHQFPMQLVILSGMILLQSQDITIKMFGLHNLFIVRTTTSHPKICYILEKARSSTTIFSCTKELVQKAIQEKSQAGQDGRPARSIVLPRTNNFSMSKVNQDVIDHTGALAMDQLLYKTSPPDCLWFTITSFCNARGTRCQDDPAQKCIHCDSQPILVGIQ
jgi:hypothetical protein